MDKDENMVTTAVEDDEALYPDGWTEDSDIFDESTWGTPGPDAQDGSETVDTEEGSEVLTTDGTTDEGDQSAEGSTEDGTSGPTDTDPADSPKTFEIDNVVVNHGAPEKVVLTEDELRAVIQKSRAFDQRKEQEQRQLYRDTYNHQLELGMSEEVALMAAERAANGKTYDLEDSTTDRNGTTDAEEIEAYYTRHPEERELPMTEDVAQAVANGTPFAEAMQDRKVAAVKAENEALKRELNQMKQHAASVARAPVTGVTGGGSTRQKTDADDDFLRGLNSPGW